MHLRWSMGVLRVIGLQSHTSETQGFNRHEIADAIVLAIRDVFYFCGLIIGRASNEELKKKKWREKLCKLICFKTVAITFRRGWEWFVSVDTECQYVTSDLKGTLKVLCDLIYDDQNTVFGNKYSK